ncbi:hypothetical protein sscle_15g102380 [Sclerotinia sclerotiorum 1980 UF-70]|uniref:DUF7924 domain-containing protein n=1 Tax=Sclerotinia sclerotiorum (strain ATCC 18683 / 1980 / Ss-1) TaxID=665079 RepID=A0A1D9QKK7_SCLS1|nr:hypothetical protein sscle_15g102380 [Sclerotinia sclerotiorum 1980 UF-70]
MTSSLFDKSWQRSVSIPQVLGSYYEFQKPLGAISYPRVQTSDPADASPLASSALVEEYLCSSQKHNHRTRKRGVDTSIETSIERPLKRARLTERNLKALENTVGQRRKSAGEKFTGQTTTTDDNLGPQYHQPESKTSNSETRDTVSPSESEYEIFAHKIRTAPNEQTVLLQTSSLLKDYGADNLRYGKVYNQAFTAFPKNVGFNTGISAPRPDMVEGLEMPEFDPFLVRQQLGGAAVPTSGTNAITLPHLAGEWKGPGKDMILVQAQAAHDGACMVYGRNKALSFLDSPDPTGHAFVSTFTIDGTILNTFAHYSSESQGQLNYHQYPISSSLLISSYEDFKKSRRRLRNLQDDAKEISERLRDELKATSVLAETDAAGTDGNSYDDEDGENPNNQLLAEYWSSFPTNDPHQNKGKLGEVPLEINDFEGTDLEDDKETVPFRKLKLRNNITITDSDDVDDITQNRKRSHVDLMVPDSEDDGFGRNGSGIPNKLHLPAIQNRRIGRQSSYFNYTVEPIDAGRGKVV